MKPTGRLLVVVAHSDDESLAAAGLMQRFSARHVLIVTDGSPRSLGHLRTRKVHAALRCAEARRALALLGKGTEVSFLQIEDQRALFHLNEIATHVNECIQTYKPNVICTHAYEGGHPDHDAVAVAVSFALRLQQSKTGSKLMSLEAPLYAEDRRGFVRNTFVDRTSLSTIKLLLTDGESARKRGMLALYKSQSNILRSYEGSTEVFRPVPSYRYECLPNQGLVYYRNYLDWRQYFGWGDVVRSAEAALGLMSQF